MKTANRRKRFWVVAVLVLAGSFVLLAANAGQFLVVDAPERADVIVVLAGETDRRPERALELLDQGYAHTVLIDVPAAAKIYGFTQVQLAEQYARSLPQHESVHICPIAGLSTKDESHDAERCLAYEQGNRILIVTSDFHTRRSLSIFRHEVHKKIFSVAGARDDTQFGMRWWTHRQWAKTCVDEWLRLFWWIVIDRWR